MKKRMVGFIVLILVCSLMFSGCIFLVAGVGALGGYAVSKDTIQGETDRGLDKLWGSALRVVSILGAIETEDRQKGIIESKVDNSKVIVKIEQLTPKTARMRVSARKYLMPNIKLAQKIYIKIIENAK